MMHKKTQQFGLCLGLLVCVLVAMIGYQEYVQQAGERVILQTVPVDPRDIFRGDFVILGYEVLNQATQILKLDGGFRTGDDFYAVLDISQSPASLQSVEKTRPQSGVYLAGKVETRRGSKSAALPSLSQYYVPEGQGRALERLRGGDLMVEASVTKNGTARIVNLLDKAGQVLDVSAL